MDSPAIAMDSTLSWSSPYTGVVPCSVPALTPLSMPHTPHTPLLTSTMASPIDNTPMLGFYSPNLNLHRPTSMKLYRSHSEGTVGMSSTMAVRKSAPKPQRRETINVSVPITYTPATHRISKAKKGVYKGRTQTVYLSFPSDRHELNHNPQATFICTIHGCGKGFHRSDLLSRHMEKHEQESRPTKPTIGHKRRISQISDASDIVPMSSPLLAVPHSIPASTPILPPATPELHSLQAAQSPFVNTQLLSPPYWTSFRRASDPAIGYSSMSYAGGDESSIFSSPECSRSPSSDGSHGSHFPFNTSHITGIGIFHEPMIDPTLMGTSLAYDPNFSGFQAFDSTAIQPSPLVTHPADGDNTRTFNHDRHWITRNPLSLAGSLFKDKSLDAIKTAHKFWVEHETRRRVLQAMFILDVHQSTLFQQPLSFLSPIPGNLPMPCASESWECTDLTAWAEYAMKGEKSTTIASASFSLVPDADLFQSSLIMSYEILSHGEGSMENLQARHPCLHLLHHGLLAAQHSPLQALVTVSNESWLFNRKVTDESQFKAAKRTLKAWVTDTDAMKLAVWHAVRVLQCALDAQGVAHKPPPVAPSPFMTQQVESLQLPTVNAFVNDGVTPLSPVHTIPRSPLRTIPGPFTMLQTNWAVYISTLICWAYGFGTPEIPASDQTLTYRYPTPANLYISTLLSLAPSWPDLTNDNIPTHVRRNTSGLLQHVRQLIIREGPAGGLLNESERVLARLIEPSFPHHRKMWEF
ncbi:uncharacterized protein GIQ15_01267 [Arthroderma uncinatum]|uniref:uncharacterized protein n=1 Tax=Arthroderma uncinatum TaxID=74035 RepID=UPI00144A7FEA|nr:uncharacterized protein GIQ15_01267 [Arthroderma uncinatum]KAF3491750.1 hypothetical protein GIQ15_01267 [Arthroderma uncinatum]